VILSRAMPKNPDAIDPKHYCCKERQIEICGFYEIHKHDEIILTDEIRPDVWNCIHCGAEHRGRNARRYDNRMWVDLDFVDIDERPVSLAEIQSNA